PRVVPGIVYDACPHRVELDIAHASEQVSIRIDDARTKTALEQGPRALVGPVHVPAVAPAQGLDQSRKAAGTMARREHVNVIRHQDESMDLRIRRPHRVAKMTQEHGSIVVVAEQVTSVVAANHEVLRDAGKVDAG